MIEGLGNVNTLEVERGGNVEILYPEFLGTSSLKLDIMPKFGSIQVSGKILRYISNFESGNEDYFSYIGDEDIKGIVAISVKDIVFKPRARLLIQLGDQLIKNESIALIELAKNSYDADASFCNVNMLAVDNQKIGLISIEDDGFGMDLYTVKNSWLEPGSDNKESLLRGKILTPKFKRLPIGEKGIGRFGVHKLGKKIELISRKKNCKEVVVKINWEEFEKYKYLNEAPIEVFERDPEIFTNDRTGTKINITSLSKNWTRGMVRDVFRALNAISTPPTYEMDNYSDNKAGLKLSNEFSANLYIDNKDWIKDIPPINQILEYSLFYFDIEIENDRINRFRYKFRPWDRFSDLKAREVTDKDDPISELLDIADPDSKKFVPLSVGNLKIGKIQFKGCVFVRDRFIFKLFSIQPTSITDYLDDNGGIRVYRNGIRVYDYGERENDWLALDYRRFNDPGVRLSNNLMLASINLDRESSSDLIEKTNREGFVDNDAYKIFKKQIIYSLKLIELLRLDDKRKIDQKYRPDRKHEPVQKSIDDLRSLLKEKVSDKKIRQQLTIYVDRIEKNYQFMNDTLIKSASAGLGWSVYIHEIEKIISEIIRVLKKDNASDRIMKLAFHLSELIESYAQILRKTTKSSQSLSKVIDQALFNIEYRLSAHRVKIDRADLIGQSYQVSVARNLIVSNIMNIVDNSIYWLDRAKVKNKTIRFDICEVSEGFISLVISDNGPGFSLSADQMIEPFVSAKPGGMGLGLHIISEVMASHGGTLSFNENEEVEVPKEFLKGATVILNFKK